MEVTQRYVFLIWSLLFFRRAWNHLDRERAEKTMKPIGLPSVHLTDSSMAGPHLANSGVFVSTTKPSVPTSNRCAGARYP